jgi:hypothetical protein
MPRVRVARVRNTRNAMDGVDAASISERPACVYRKPYPGLHPQESLHSGLNWQRSGIFGFVSAAQNSVPGGVALSLGQLRASFRLGVDLALRICATLVSTWNRA